MNKLNTLIMLLCSALSTQMFVACDEGLDEYYGEHIFNIYEHEMNIGTDLSRIIRVECSSIWKVVPGADWILPNKEFGNTSLDSVRCDFIANRTDEVRKGYIYIDTFFKENPRRDSILVIQDVTDTPELTIPELEYVLLGDVTKLTIPLSYNYGAKLSFTDPLASWIRLMPTGEVPNVNELPNVGNELAHVNLEIEMDKNNSEDREAILHIETVNGTGPCSVDIKIIQQSAFEALPAITSYSEDFSFVSKHNVPFSQGDLFHVFVDKDFPNFARGLIFGRQKCMLIYSPQLEVTGFFMIDAPFNVKAMTNKTLKYNWNKGNTKAHNGKLEVVASTNFKGNVFSPKTEWVVLKDVTSDPKAGMGLPNLSMEVGLEQFADCESVYLAFRYTGNSGAYRITNLTVGK